MARIATKKAYYRLWRAGVLGNRPRTWKDAETLRASGWSGPVVMRSTQVGWKTLYGITVREALDRAATVPGATFNECLPDHLLLIQGEAQRSERGIDLHYSFTQKPMKLALAAAPRSASGLYAKMLLDHFLWPTSRDDLDALWDLYPDAVIEFSTYSIAIGDQPHRNTLIWEVRDY
jgi:hypothetical protein